MSSAKSATRSVSSAKSVARSVSSAKSVAKSVSSAKSSHSLTKDETYQRSQSSLAKQRRVVSILDIVHLHLNTSNLPEPIITT